MGSAGLISSTVAKWMQQQPSALRKPPTIPEPAEAWIANLKPSTEPLNSKPIASASKNKPIAPVRAIAETSMSVFFFFFAFALFSLSDSKCGAWVVGV